MSKNANERQQVNAAIWENLTEKIIVVNHWMGLVFSGEKCKCYINLLSKFEPHLQCLVGYRNTSWFKTKNKQNGKATVS